MKWAYFNNTRIRFKVSLHNLGDYQSWFGWLVGDWPIATCRCRILCLFLNIDFLLLTTTKHVFFIKKKSTRI